MLKKLNIGQKLLLLILIPILGGAVLFVDLAIERLALYRNMQQVEMLTELSLVIEDVVHEFQKERGLTSGYYGSDGKKFSIELQQQRIKTDEKREKLLLFLNKVDLIEFEKENQDMKSMILEIIKDLDEHRELVWDYSVSSEDAIFHYTQMNDSLLNIISSISRYSANSEIALSIIDYANFLRSKEKAGLERALLTSTFSQGYYGEGMYQKHQFLIHAQENYLKLFLSNCSSNLRTTYQDISEDNSFLKVDEMRRIALSLDSSQISAINPTELFSTITTKLNLLKKMEIDIARELKSETYKIRKASIGFLTKSIVLSVVLFLLTLTGVRLIIRHLKKNLSILNVAAIEIANENYETKIDINSEDELGVLASTFNKMTLAIKNATEDLQSSNQEYQSLSGKYELQNNELLAINNNLFKKEKQLTKAQKIAHLGSWELNHETGSVKWSSEVYRIFNLKRSQFKPNYRKVLELIHPEDRRKVDSIFKKMDKKNKGIHLTHRIKLKDGTIKIVDTYGEMFQENEGSVFKTIGIIQDVTELKAKEFELEKSVVEKNILLKEIHHRVKNNLQIISALLSLKETDEPGVMSFVKESNARIRSMALLHEKIYQVDNVGVFSFKEYVESLLSELIFSFVKENTMVTYSTNIDDSIRLNIKDAINLGLIITEIVTNALKYAFEGVEKGEVSISFLKQKENKVHLQVKDNGKGIHDLDGNKDTMGSIIIESLSSQLKGKITRENNDGTEYNLIFENKEIILDEFVNIN